MQEKSMGHISPIGRSGVNTLKSDYQAYRARLRKTIREAKRMFYARTFLMYKNVMKKTREVISDTLKRSCKSKSQAKFMYENHVMCA